MGWDLKGVGTQRVGPQGGGTPKGHPIRTGETRSWSWDVSNPKGTPRIALYGEGKPRGAARPWGSLGSHPKGSPHKNRGSQVTELRQPTPQKDGTPKGPDPKVSPHKDRGKQVMDVSNPKGMGPQRVTP